jgi:2-dehydro-3-deoxygalactonokinase
MALSPSICVDIGTTNTRGWLLHDGRVVATHRVAAGVRDTARTGSRAAVVSAMRGVCDRLTQQGTALGFRPAFVAGAGMIGAPLGLAEVPHVEAPAAVTDIAAGAIRLQIPDATDLPIVLVPGVKTSQAANDPLDGDVMRGEETLCVGLLRQAIAAPGDCVLNLGSHWKLIGLDASGRVAWSETTLSGELAHAAWRETILADALPLDRPDTLPADWSERGRAAARERGLARALFGVRLMALRGEATPAERLAYFYGAFVESDFQPWLRRGRLGHSRIVITGSPVVGAAWASALQGIAAQPHVIDERAAETALLEGLQAILQLLTWLPGA